MSPPVAGIIPAPTVLGTKIGNYEVVALLGHGGMGAVYRAHHAALDRSAAVKVLLPEMSHRRELVTRFFNEARAATSIRHPGIIEVFDFGYLPDGSGYITMEFLDGETLGALRARVGRLTPERVLTLARQIAGALSAAHESGIVHRDLKPDNVFLVADPEVPSGERIKVLDFGIAKLTTEPGDVSHTQTGSVIGTPTYMSPEQCRGQSTIDGRADFYALGCLLYELVCGRPPFLADSVGDLIAHHLYFEPTAPREIEPTLPPAVEQLLLWLLQKDPAARPANARILIEAIDRITGFVGTQPSFTRPGITRPPEVRVATPTTLSATTGASAVSRPRRRWTIRAMSGALVLVLGAGVWLGLAHTSAPAPQLAPPPPSAPVATMVPAPDPGATAAAPPSTAPTTPTPIPAPPQEAAATPSEVRIAITSIPDGAAVVVDGKRVGTTPFDERVPRASRRDYQLQKTGFEPAKISPDTMHDDTLQITLKKKRPRGRHDLGSGGVNPFE